MSETTGFNGGQVLMAFLGGAVAGATIALLTAPQSGAKTRAQLRDGVMASADSAARLPHALQGAVVAAQDAFSESLTKSNNALAKS